MADYARCYNLPTAVFRMSCIYGPHQCGNEDQGWVAHFLIQTLEGKPITIFGDGCQVRDILFVEDLAEAMLLVHENIDRLSGAAFNMGGGPQNAVSLREVLRLAAELHGEDPLVTYDDWRTGDQRYYVSDTSRFQEVTGWFPKVSAQEGITRLYNWLAEARSIRRVNLATGEVG